MPDKLKAKLDAAKTVIADGGTASELRRRGVGLDRTAWSALANLSHWDTLKSIHSDYIAAGAEVLTANTFASSRFMLDAAGVGERFEEINRRALDAAFRAREESGKPVAVAGSISCLPPNFDRGAYPTRAAELSAYVELAELFAASGADLIALEMMQDAGHASLACRAARESGLPFWLGISLRREQGTGAWTAFDDGEAKIEDWFDGLLAYGPSAVNLMHMKAEEIEAAIETIGNRWSGTIGALPAVAESHDDSPVELGYHQPAALADSARRWTRAGARLIGGCCGTTPAHIRAIAAALTD